MLKIGVNVNDEICNLLLFLLSCNLLLFLLSNSHQIEYLNKITVKIYLERLAIVVGTGSGTQLPMSLEPISL